MCENGQDNLRKLKLSIRMGEKGDLSDTENGMVVGVSKLV